MSDGMSGAIRCFVWGAKGAVEELPTIPFRAIRISGGKPANLKARLLPVGRLRYYYKWPGHGSNTWHRLRYWPTRRRVLDIRGEYNPENPAARKDHCRQAADLVVLGLLALAIAPLFTPLDLQIRC